MKTNRVARILFLAAVAVVSAKLLLSVLHADSSAAYEKEVILGDWTRQRAEAAMEKAGEIRDPGAKIEFLSEKFLGTPYAENTLGGSADLKEVLTVNLSGLDCFTYIDYVESMRRSRGFAEFLENLAAVRYKDAAVRWERRRHFFSDWASGEGKNARDATVEIGGKLAVTEKKKLNRKADGSLWLAGIEVVEREVSYIPSERLGPEMLDAVRAGDYIGIYSDEDGLDVSHTGIAVRKNGKLYLRHASSRHRRVLDENLAVYVKKRPGLVVYRSNEP